MKRIALVAHLAVLLASSLHARENDREFVESLRKLTLPKLQRSAIGVTRHGTAITCFFADDDLDLNTATLRILLVGGLDGRRDSVQSVLDSLRWFHEDAAKSIRERVTLSAVPCANPDGTARGTGEMNASGGYPSRGYPPKGTAYNDKSNPESLYLWRWIGMHAPDLVVDVRAGKSLRWFVPASLDAVFQRKVRNVPEDSLVRQLPRVAPNETGTVPSIQVETPGGFLPQLITMLDKARFSGPSNARRELQRRLDRSPLEIAKQLSQHYGHDLKQVVYIPAIALIGRLRLGQLTESDKHLKEVAQIALPYFRGEKSTTPRSGSALSGHLVFCELADQVTGDPRKRYVELARVAADLAFDERGQPKPSMPFHSEMSDALFMGGPILARVGRLTGKARYFDACAQHIAFMKKLVLREDGLHRQSPLDEAAWGRGNGFPALGLAMCLTDFPKDHPRRAELLEMFQNHMATLAKHQDPTGMWHQVVDHEESYRELSSTCMITFAMIRGVRKGWLRRETYRPVIDRAWGAIRLRIAPNGRLVNVCTGTGKQKSLRAYYDRAAILGHDARGGAMALLVATEVARLPE